jgi:transcription elongation factor Elf1
MAEAKPVKELDQDPERRRSGLAGRRKAGRRADDRIGSEFSAIIPCLACGVAWAALSSVALDEGQSVATYRCPRCGDEQTVVGPG